ncbi:glutathione peroxidase [Paenibacillus baekrokdamisoli]|uniref:Glutathione peroxidase n=1 Tax=Paenibacillus baekrokdamisoli TaxID=1712516 RepID=A0A3G9IN55_9BACL|nr:glutathione peroxidase [Paenibacillus baekrokdamisoli]MBB3072004.1 glutathione peroxidase [Paenibacillus baekrokdamisoli]BBH20307.1 glutathione peroxidase [Paenibacillus baekrokdamisoli]
MSIYEFQATTINGTPIELSAYRGQVLLIINTASKCSYSRQFADLQSLYESHREQGFEILGFPCNQFNQKEPGSNTEVQAFCEIDYGVTFPLFEKIDVRGSSAHPLFQYLTQQSPFQGFDTQTVGGQTMQDFLQEKYPEIYAGDGVKWNFSKFLIDRNGLVKARFETPTEPHELEPAIDLLL